MKKMPGMSKSLAFKLTVLILLVNTVVLSSLGVHYSRRFAQYIELQLAAQSKVPATLMTERALNYSMVRDTDALGKLVGRTVQCGMMVDPEARIVYSSDRKLEGALLWRTDPGHPVFEQLENYAGQVRIRKQVHRTSRTRNVVFPIYAHGNPAGYLWMAVDTAADMRFKEQVTLIFFLGTLLCILVGGFSQAVMVHRLVVPRILRTVRCLSAVERGDLGARIPGNLSDDEIGVLENSVNTMVCEIESHTSALKQAVQDMEQAKQVAERASAAKSEFLANTSHEIRTPLNGILGMSEILLDSSLDGEQRDQIKTILASGESLLKIINNILDLACVESGRLEVVLEPLELDALFYELEKFFMPSVLNTGIALKLQVDERIPHRIRAAHGPLRQILTNLMGNAFKFTREGYIGVTATLEEIDEHTHRCRIKFRVEDTGIGIPESAINKVFEAFAQADGSHTRRYGGTGLGLTISSQMVSQLCGQLEVSSVEGQGATFFFTLPFSYLVEDPAQIAASLPEVREVVASDNALSGIRVLVVEDNKVNRVMARTFLRKAGCEVLEAEDGQQAVDLLGFGDAGGPGERVDLILMDIQMPVLDGLEATRMIREREDPGHRVPIIACTAHAMQGDKETFIRAGMDDYVAKPIRKQPLIDVLMRYVDPVAP